jgi:centromere/kinetochore protein ZW10
LQNRIIANVCHQKEIRSISSESAPEVDAWIQHARALKEDIDRTRAFAGETSRQADAGDILHQTIKAAEDRVEFLSKEATYSQQVGGALRIIKDIRDFLDRAEQSAIERNILEALQLLSSML